jgi:putative membrane protein
MAQGIVGGHVGVPPAALARPPAAAALPECGPVRLPLTGGANVSLILSWLILSAAVWVTAMVLPGFHVKSFGSAILVAALFGVLNFLLGWLFMVVFTIATLGLALLLAFITRWIVNAIVLKLVDALTDHLTIDSFGWALLGALMMSALGTVGEWLVRGVFF